MPTRAAWRFAVAHHRRGQYALALEHCLAADPTTGDLADQACLAAVNASAQWAQGAAEESRVLADLALKLAQESGDDDASAFAWVAQALVSALEGDQSAALYAYGRALEHAERAGDVWTQIRIRNNLGSLHIRGGRAADALQHLDQAVALAESVPVGVLAALVEVNRGEALLALGRLDEALAEARAAADIYRSSASPMLAFALLVEAEAHRVRGSATRARIAYQEAIERVRGTGNAQVLVAALAGLARTTVLDDPAAAASLAAQAVAQPAALGEVRALQAAGWVALATGDHATAAAWAARSIEEAGRRHDLPELADALELRALSRTDRPGAPELAEALEIWVETGNAIRAAVNRLVAGRLLDDRVAEEAAMHAIEALGVRADAFGIAGPLQAVGRAARPEVSVRTLGSFVVHVGGVPVPASAWGSRKNRDIVKILAARRGRPISRHALAEMLWPGVRDVSGRLSTALSGIRAVLDPDRARPPDHFLSATREQVRLDPTTVAIDLAAFDEVARTALAASRAGAPDAVRLLQAAAAHYVAPFLADEPASEWADEVRDELASTSLAVKRALADQLTAHGAVDQAITWLVALLAEEPYDERAHVALVRLLARAGRHGEARRARRTYEARMEDIGVEPSDDLPASSRPPQARRFS